VSVIFAMLTYIFSSSVGLLVLLIYMFVVLIQLLIYFVTLNQLRCQWKFENPPRIDWNNSGDLSNKSYNSDSKLDVRLVPDLNEPSAYFKGVDCIHYLGGTRPVDTKERDQLTLQENIRLNGEINQEHGGTKASQTVHYKKSRQLTNIKKKHKRYSSESASSRAQWLTPRNLTPKDLPQKKLRLPDGKLDKDVLSLRPMSRVFTAPSRPPAEPVAALAESKKNTKMMILPSSRLAILQEGGEANVYPSVTTLDAKKTSNTYVDDISVSSPTSKFETSLLRFAKPNVYSNTQFSSGYMSRMSTGISANSSYSDILGFPSEYKYSIHFENLTRRSSMVSMTTGFFTDILDAESIVEANVCMEGGEDVSAPTVKLQTQLKAVLISLEEYRRPIARVDLKVGKVTEDLVCDFCFNDIKVGEVLFTAPDVLSCLSLLKGVHLCSSCFHEKTNGRRIKRCTCKNCDIVSIVDIQALQDTEKWRLNFCAECYNNGNLWFEVSREEVAFWQICEDEADEKGRVSKLQILTSKMLDDLLDFYYSTRRIVSKTNSNIRSMVNINRDEKNELWTSNRLPGVCV